MTQVHTGNAGGHIEDLTLADGKASFSHGVVNRASVTVTPQPTGKRIPIPYAFEDNGGSFTDESVDARDTGDNDVNLLPATPAVNDAFYFGANHKFERIIMQDGTDGAGTWTIVQEYWDGDSWATLTVNAVSSDFTDVSDEVYWVAPSDWKKYTVNGVRAYWVRFRVSAYTSVTTRPQAKSIDLVLTANTPGQDFGYADELLEEFVVYGDATAIPMYNMNDVVLTEYKVDGNAATGTDLAGFEVPFDGEITRVELSFATNGTTGTNTIDVNIGGTTIFTTQGNRPSLAHDATDGISSITAGTDIEAGSFSAGDRITIDVDAVATGVAPTDIVATVYGRYKPYYQDEGQITKVVVSAATVGTDDLTSIAYARQYDATGDSYTDEDTASQEGTDNDVELLLATVVADDGFYYGCDVPFYKIVHIDGTDGVHTDAVITWEYYSSTDSDWKTLPISAVSSDYTDVSDPIYFDNPGDWALTTVDSQSAFWVRSRVTTAGTWSVLPQAGGIQLGISAVVDINVAGTTIFTTQGYRAVLHDDTNDDVGEVLGGRVGTNGVFDSSGIEDGRFTRNQLISADIDYAAPSTGVEPVDLKVQVYGSYFNSGQRESFDIAENDKRRMTVFSDGSKSNAKIRVQIDAVY